MRYWAAEGGVRIGVLSNLRAGRGGRVTPRVRTLLRAYPEVRHVEMDGPRSPDALLELARPGIDLLVVNGGDGTLQCALSELLGVPELEGLRAVAPLRSGRTSMTAIDLGARRDPVVGLRNLLEAARAGRLDALRVERPVLRVRSTRRPRPQYGLYFGGGAVRRAIALTHRLFPEGRSQGAFGAGVVTAGTLARMALGSRRGILAPDKLQLACDDEPPRDGAFTLCMASTLGRLLLRMRPFWGEGPGPVRFMAIESGARHLGPRALGLLRGRARPFVTPANGYHAANAWRVRLRLDCGFTLDGELFEPEPDETVTLEGDRRIAFYRA